MRWFLDLAGFSTAQITDLLTLASHLDRSPPHRSLEGRVVGLLALDKSRYSRLCLQTAMARLGGQTIDATPFDGAEFETDPDSLVEAHSSEHILDAIPTITAYCDALAVRSLGYGDDLVADLGEKMYSAIANACRVPLINLESSINNPTESLATWKTLDDKKIPGQGGRFVLTWAWHPDPLPYSVPAAVLHSAATRGMRVTVLRPDGFALPDTVMEKARRAAQASGGAVLETNNRVAALDGAHVLYARSWAAPRHYGSPQADAALRAKLRNWSVDELWFTGAQEDCWFLHSPPIQRGSEVDPDVLEGARNVGPLMGRNRMAVQMAVLYRMLAAGQQQVERRDTA